VPDVCSFCSLDAENDVFPFGRERVRQRAVQVDHHACDRRIGAVQAHAHTLYAVSSQRVALLFRVGERSGKDQDQPIRVGGGLYRRLHLSGEDHFDLYVRTLALDLQLLDFRYASGRVLAGSVGSQEEERQK
jgi:hypothetical protein